MGISTSHHINVCIYMHRSDAGCMSIYGHNSTCAIAQETATHQVAVAVLSALVMLVVHQQHLLRQDWALVPGHALCAERRRTHASTCTPKSWLVAAA